MSYLTLSSPPGSWITLPQSPSDGGSALSWLPVMSTENRTAQDFSLLKSFRAASLVGMGKWGGEKHSVLTLTLIL